MVLKQSEKAGLMRKAIKLASAGLSVSRISADLKIARSTLSDWLGKAKKAEINFEMIKNLSDDEIDEIFFPAGRTTRDLYQPRWDEIHIAMGKHGTVLSDQYRRYLSSVPEGRTAMSKSLFHSEYRRMKDTFPDDVVAMHAANTFYPGRIAMIDYSGDPLVMRSGALAGKKLQVFVGVLPFSSLTFVVATETQRRGDWLRAIAGMFKFYGGVTEELWLDNSTSLVMKADKFDPVLSPEFRNFCAQYEVKGVAVPPHAPRAKASVERAVGLVQKKILPAIVELPLSTMEEVNRAVLLELERFNGASLTDGSRESRRQRFEAEESVMLKPLPSIEYAPDCEVLDRKILRQNQVRINNVRYGVRWGHAGRMARIYLDKQAGTVRIYLLDTFEEIGLHSVRKPGSLVPTEPGHVPEQVRRYFETREELLKRIESEIGAKARELGECLSRSSGTQAVRLLNGMLVLFRKHGADAVEDASDKVLAGPRKTFRALVQLIVGGGRNGTKGQKPVGKPSRGHVRGSEYYRNNSEEKENA